MTLMQSPQPAARHHTSINAGAVASARVNRLPAIARILFALAVVAALPSPRTPAAQTPVLSSWLQTTLRQARPDERHIVWIYFRDKGSLGAGRFLTTIAREDLPVERTYVTRIASQVSRIRHESRWLNAVSAEATGAQVNAVASLPFIARVDLVKRYRRPRGEIYEPPNATAAAPRTRAQGFADTSLDYGTSQEQLAQLRVPELHARGRNGQGIVVAVFDSGFPNLGHESTTSSSPCARPRARPHAPITCLDGESWMRFGPWMPGSGSTSV